MLDNAPASMPHFLSESIRPPSSSDEVALKPMDGSWRNRQLRFGSIIDRVRRFMGFPPR
jgi:hypothetical protein